MEAKYSSETSVEFQRTTRRYTPKDMTHHNHRSEDLNFNKFTDVPEVHASSIFKVYQRYWKNPLATGFVRALSNVYQNTRLHFTDDSNLPRHNRQNRRSHTEGPYPYVTKDSRTLGNAEPIIIIRTVI
jgi:hypothetical protein